MDELIVNNSTLIVVGAMALFYFHVLMSPARVEGGPPVHEVTVMGGFLMRLTIPLRGPDGQMLAPALPNLIDLYLQMLEQMLSQPTGAATRRMRRGGAGQYTED